MTKNRLDLATRLLGTYFNGKVVDNISGGVAPPLFFPL